MASRLYAGEATWYYPRIRGNVLHLTIFAALGIAALCSASVGQHADSDLTFLNVGTELANAACRELNDSLSKMCAHERFPDPRRYRQVRFRLPAAVYPDARKPGRQVSGLSALLTPLPVLHRAFGGDRAALDTLAALERCCAQSLEALQADGCHHPPQPRGGARRQDSVRGLQAASRLSALLLYDGGVSVASGRAFAGDGKKPDYTVVAPKGMVSEGSVYTVDSGLCLVIRGREPFTLFEISEQNFVAAASDYILQLADPGSKPRSAQRRRTMERIWELIRALDDA